MTPANILIVEDELIVARDIQNRLVRLGYTVAGIARLGEDATRLAAETHPDLVLMDIHLAGDMDGITAASEIRAGLRLPVVFLTAYADEDTVGRARVAEPYGYILKPFDERDLRTVIEMALYKHEAELKLQASERRYAITLASIGDAVIATDEQGLVNFLNPTAAALTGWSPDEAVGHPIDEVFRIVDEYSREHGNNPVASVLRDGRTATLAEATVLISRDGREVPIEDSAAPIVDEDGRISGAVQVFQDVSERRGEQEKLRLSRALLDRSNDTIEVIDPQSGRFLDVNESACLTHGYTRDEYLALTLPDIDLSFADPRAWEEGIAYLKKHGSRLLESQHRRKDGSTFPVEVNVTYVELQREYLLAIVRDITERKRVEQELACHRAHLEELVAERTSALKEANLELESFSYSVSHDLRTPLRAINGFSRLLDKKYEEQLDTEAQRLLKAVRDNTARMSQLIDDILAFSRAGRLELQFAKVDMGQMVRAAWLDLEPLRAGRDIHLEVKALAPVRGDPAMLQQVWSNLLANAIKFTKSRTTAHVEVGGMADGGDYTYYVKDDGVGFDPTYTHKLFGVFQRLHGVEEFEGTGIGLAIVKRIVARHGGRVMASGRLREGAMFQFTLPSEGV